MSFHVLVCTDATSSVSVLFFFTFGPLSFSLYLKQPHLRASETVRLLCRHCDTPVSNECMLFCIVYMCYQRDLYEYCVNTDWINMIRENQLTSDVSHYLTWIRKMTSCLLLLKWFIKSWHDVDLTWRCWCRVIICRAMSNFSRNSFF